MTLIADTLFLPPTFHPLALETPYHVSICLWPFVHEQPEHTKSYVQNLLSCLICNRLEVNKPTFSGRH